MTSLKNYLVLALVLILANFTALNAKEKKIALCYPQLTISSASEDSTWLIDNYYRWELFLMQNKYRYDVIKDSDLDDDLSDDYALLILPAVKCLNPNSFNAIKQYLEDGNSILATSSMGTLNSDGGWNGWENLEQLFGIKFLSEIPKEDHSKIHSVLGAKPFSFNIQAGFRLQITTDDKPIESRIINENTKPIGYWLENEIPFEGKKEGENTTSAVYGSYGKGNFVWFGFEFAAIVGNKLHQKVAKQLLKNAIDWLIGDLIIQLETWPKGKQSAAVISCDVEFKFDLINNAIDIIEQENILSQYYILVESINFPSLERLSRIGSVGLHGDDHTLFKGLDSTTQFNRLTNALDSLEKLIGKKPISFRPPETFYDDVTLQAMTANGIKVLSSDFIGDRAVPQFLESHPNLLIIPKTGFDDYDIFYVKKMEQATDQSELYTLDFLRTYEEGSLYTLNYHTQIQCRDDLVSALIKPIQEMKSKNVWVTTHDSVYYWWACKDKAKLSSKVLNEKQYLIELTNTGNASIDGLIVSIQKRNLLKTNAPKCMLNDQILDYTTNYDIDKIQIQVPVIRSKDTVQINIEF